MSITNNKLVFGYLFYSASIVSFLIQLIRIFSLELGDWLLLVIIFLGTLLASRNLIFESGADRDKLKIAAYSSLSFSILLVFLIIINLNMEFGKIALIIFYIISFGFFGYYGLEEIR
jgi:hypothetical protein